MNTKSTWELLAAAIVGDYVSKPSDLAPAMLGTAAQQIMTIQHALNSDSHGACIPDADALLCELGALARRMEACATVVRLLERGAIKIEGYDDEKPSEARQ